MFESNDPLRVEYVDGHTWMLLEDFVYTDPKVGRITVPTGFLTDFASIPKVFWNILPPTGTYGKAAVVHDFLYVYGHSDTQPVSRRDADRILREASQVLGSSRFVRWTMWSAVTLFASRLWARRRKASHAKSV